MTTPTTSSRNMNVHELIASNEKAKQVWETESSKYTTKIFVRENQPELVGYVWVFTFEKFLFFNRKITVYKGNFCYDVPSSEPETTQAKLKADEYLKEYVLCHAGFIFKSNWWFFYRGSDY
jgi:hypothetical protein